jgi:SAM-dependent methyltransferase
MVETAHSNVYRQRARYYDPIYHFKDYASEASRLRELLTGLGIADGSNIVDAACGTGSHLVHLREWYSVSGFDLSDGMLALAREKMPTVRLWQRDMTDFALDAPVDAMLCLFSSIGYVFPENRLRAAAACFAAAVRPGGVLIIEPWIEPETFTPGFRMMQTYDGDEVKLCRMTVSGREQRDGVDLAVLDFFWQALHRNSDCAEHWTERHELWLCSRALMKAIFEDAGFEMKFVEDGLMRNRGLLIGQRRELAPLKPHTRETVQRVHEDHAVAIVGRCRGFICYADAGSC